MPDHGSEKMQSLAWHSINQSGRIAYNRVAGKTPGIIFLCGHGSDMDGSKALFLESWAKQQGVPFCGLTIAGMASQMVPFWKPIFPIGRVTRLPFLTI
jgi:hypothetical protein